MWSEALRWEGGAGSAFWFDKVVDAEEGVSGEGEMGTGERIRAIPAGADAMGFGVGIGDEGMRSACGTGRRRLRMEDAGSVTTRCLGTVADGSGGGFGGEGGGECWYVVVLL
jgi:hypothetical protein